MENTENRKYYFISYQCRRRSSDRFGRAEPTTQTMCQDVIDKHPLDWQQECNDKYSPQRENPGGYKVSEEYMVHSWNELTETEYNKFKGTVG